MASDSTTVLDLLEKYPVAAIASTDLLTAYEGCSMKKFQSFLRSTKLWVLQLLHLMKLL